VGTGLNSGVDVERSPRKRIRERGEIVHVGVPGGPFDVFLKVLNPDNHRVSDVPNVHLPVVRVNPKRVGVLGQADDLISVVEAGVSRGCGGCGIDVAQLRSFDEEELGIQVVDGNAAIPHRRGENICGYAVPRVSRKRA